MRIASPAAPLPHLELLTEARKAQAQNYILASGCMARAVLERHLKLLCDWYTGPVRKKKYPGIPDYASALFRHRFIDRESKQRIRDLAGIGNRAAHGDPITWYEACKILDGVEEILNRYPLSDHQLAKIDEYSKLYDASDDDDDEGEEWKGVQV